MTNGLAPKDHKMLTERLRQLDWLYGRRPHLGGGEAEKIKLLADKIRVRLDPIDPAELDREAEAIIEPCRGSPWFDPAMEAV